LKYHKSELAALSYVTNWSCHWSMLDAMVHTQQDQCNGISKVRRLPSSGT